MLNRLKFDAFLLALGLFCFCETGLAQVFQSENFNHTITGDIHLIHDQLDGTTALSPEADNRIESAQLSLVNSEVVIRYRLSPTASNQFYNIKIKTQLDDQDLDIRPENILGDYRGSIESTGDEKTIILTRLLETFGDLDGIFKVTLEADYNYIFTLPPGLDCDNPPVFGSREKLSYYIAGGAGLAMIVAGIGIQSQSDKVYDDDYLTATAETAQVFYDKAQSKQDAATLLSIAGGAIIVGDAILFYLRNKKHKRLLDDYEKYCNKNETIGVRPFFEPSISAQESGNVGLQFTFSF